MNVFRSMLSEVLGTFWICFFSMAAVLSSASPIKSELGLLGLALTYGLAWAAAVCFFAGVSRVQFNPAITVGLFVAKGTKLTRALMSIFCQLVGAALAALLCNAAFPEEAIRTRMLALPAPCTFDALPQWNSAKLIFLFEFVLAFFVVTAYFSTVVDQRGQRLKIGAWGLGLAVALGVLVGERVSGAVMNPARWFGPALLLMQWKLHWSYWLAPVLAGLVVGLLYRFLMLEQDIEVIDEEEELPE